MLNISGKNPITEDLRRYHTVKQLEVRPHYKVLNKILTIVSVIAVIILFLPWTQHISGSGAVTTLKPEQRPQTVQNAIAGRIEKWYVREGDFVEKGDTILFISEIKEDYLDPDLVENIRTQADAKRMSQQSYGGKATSLNQQLQAIIKEKRLKLAQAQNKHIQARLKIKSDSIDLVAVKTQIRIAQTQFDRALNLNREGLKPLSDFEEKRLKLQEMEAKVITQENKLYTSRNELLNAKIEINRIGAEYSDKASKTQSEQYSALSSQFDTKAQVNKLENQYASYKIRNGLYYIKAPQSGYVSRALQSGLGETIKEGTSIISIMPSQYEIAVETFIEPNDLPLVRKNGKIRVWFDGWPTIVFSGWPGMSYGTFGGRVIAVENFISENGKFRVLIAPDPQEAQWPSQLRMGSGAQTLALMDNVPIWFELWRNLNGFPPNYYKTNPKEKKK